MRAGAPTLLAALLAAGAALAGDGGVSMTRHNLSVTGPGPVRSTSEDQICVFCHASHVQGASSPLWNRQTSGAVAYTPYESATLSARAREPDGASKLCMSCHDGTIALGSVRTREDPIPVRGAGASGRLADGSPSNLGFDLSGTHPVSLRYDEAMARGRDGVADTWLRPDPMAPDGSDLLDRGGKVQCTSCHDPHSDPAAEGLPVPPFWRGDSFSQVCEACHVAPMADLSHEDPASITDGCGSCHVGHGESRQPLLPEREEEACFGCHGPVDNVLGARDANRLGLQERPTRMDDLFNQPYTHPVRDSSGEHQPGEDTLGMGAGVRRHVECVDCHATHGSALPQDITRNRGAGGTVLLRPDGRTEYELCYDCHSSNANLPFGETDKSLEFDTSNASYHPIEGPAAGSSPSLLAPWAPGDTLLCSDCHGPEAGDERAGPHGSRNPWILKGRYVVLDGGEESRGSYEACYTCHSRDVILSGVTFEGHADHVVAGGVSCYSCHDSHGSPEYPGLIRFNKDIRYGRVDPSSSGRLDYDAESGACYLSCHGVDHDPLGYP